MSLSLSDLLLLTDEVNQKDRPAALVAVALCDVASAIRYAADTLGINQASTPMGAIEVLSNAVVEGFRDLSGSIDEAVETLKSLQK